VAENIWRITPMNLNIVDQPRETLEKCAGLFCIDAKRPRMFTRGRKKSIYLPKLGSDHEAHFTHAGILKKYFCHGHAPPFVLFWAIF
jgi:hypothetical protein